MDVQLWLSTHVLFHHVHATMNAWVMSSSFAQVQALLEVEACHSDEAATIIAQLSGASSLAGVLPACSTSAASCASAAECES